MRRIAIGIDPDTHYTAVAVSGLEGIEKISVAHVPAACKGVKAVQESMVWAHSLAADIYAHLAAYGRIDDLRLCVESQQVYTGASAKGNQDDLIRLAHVAGSVAGAFLALLPQARLIMPLPNEWKGSVPKEIHQARILKQHEGRLLCELPAGCYRSHSIDAIGLASWARVKLLPPS